MFWLILALIITLLILISYLTKRNKNNQRITKLIQNELESKVQKLQESETKRAQIEIKYIKKLKAAEEKKNNLAKYRNKKRSVRKQKSIQQQVADLVGKDDKWLPHSSSLAKPHKIGKPIGGRGAGRTRPIVIHKEIELTPKKCDKCETDLANQKAYFAHDSVVTELFHEEDEMGHYKYYRLKNILKKVYRKKCPTCKKWVYPDQWLFANARFGVGFVCYIISERIQTRLPYEKLIEELGRRFGGYFSLSDTSIINWFKKFEEQLKDMYEQLKEMLKEDEFVHVDETGLPMDGENWWLWILVTANVVLFKVSESRGHESIEDIIKGFEGTIIADFFSAYSSFKDNPHQKCLAHLLSAIIEIVVKNEKENGRIDKKIQKHYESVQAETNAKNPNLPKKRGRKTKLEILSEKELELLQNKKKKNAKVLQQSLRLGSFFKQPFNPDNIYSWQGSKFAKIAPKEAKAEMMEMIEEIRSEGHGNDEIRKILNRCDKFQDSLFTYLDYDAMPPDNNVAERGLRHFAVQRRVSGGFKSPPLMKHFAVYLSLYMTCKANLKSFEEILSRVLSKESLDLRSFLFTKS